MAERPMFGVGRIEGSPGRDEIVDTQLEQMLTELRRALYDAISDSGEVHRTWRRLKDRGYSLYLMVDCKRDSDEDVEEDTTVGRHLPVKREKPAFRINGDDLSFLKSIGIDPTRRAPRRGRSS